MKRKLALAALLVPLFLPRLAAAESVRRRVPIAVQGDKFGVVLFGQLALKIEETGQVHGLKDSFVQLFNDRIRHAGYRVPAIERSVFKEDELPDSDFVVAGSIMGLECSDEEDVTCGITVDWEVFDRRASSVVYKMTAKHEEKGLSKLGNEGARALLLGTLDSLLSRARFAEAVSNGKGGVVSSQVEYEPQTIKRCAAEKIGMPKGSDKALAGVVVIRSKGGVGSGVVISPDGFIVTAAHVVPSDEVEVRFKDGGVSKADVVRLDEAHDVALLRLHDPARAKACLVLDTDTPKAGDDVFVLGSPGGEELSFSVTRGIVSGMRTFKGVSYLQTDAPMNPGNSGGPLVGENGSVLAIASFKVVADQMEGLGFGVPSSVILNKLAIRFGDETDTISARVSRGANTASVVADNPDPNFWYVGDNAPGKTPGWVGALRGYGYLTAIIGSTTVLTTWILSLKTDPDSFLTYRTWNTVGWIATGVGAGMVVSSYVFKPNKTPPPDTAAMPYGTPEKPQVSAGFGFASVNLEVKF